MSAPESRSNLAHFVWPAATAHRKGVNPLVSLESKDAQFLSRISRHSGFPKDAALQWVKKKIVFLRYDHMFGLSTELRTKGKSLRQSESIGSDQELTLETSALEYLYGGQFTFSYQHS